MVLSCKLTQPSCEPCIAHWMPWRFSKLRVRHKGLGRIDPDELHLAGIVFGSLLDERLLLLAGSALGVGSGEDDEESRVLAESLGVVTLLDKAEFGRVLIPAILQT